MDQRMMQSIMCPSHGHSHGMNLGLCPQCPRVSQGVWAGWHPWDLWRKGIESAIGTGWCQVCPAGWCQRCVRILRQFWFIPLFPQALCAALPAHPEV